MAAFGLSSFQCSMKINLQMLKTCSTQQSITAHMFTPLFFVHSCRREQRLFKKQGENALKSKMFDSVIRKHCTHKLQRRSATDYNDFLNKWIIHLVDKM